MLIDVVLPCLNEAAALPWVLARMPSGYRPIVADNGSLDGSAATAARLGAAVVHVPQRGFGAACHGGLLAATADVVCFMDADGSLDPADLPLIAGPVADGTADLVMGRRRPAAASLVTGGLARSDLGTGGPAPADLGTGRGSPAGRPAGHPAGRAFGRGGWPLHARLGNRVVAAQVRRRTGIPLRDIGPMRAVPRAGLLRLGLRDRRFGYPLEMVVRAAEAGWRVSERDVPYRPRTGKSKVTGTVGGTLRTVRDMSRVLTAPPAGAVAAPPAGDRAALTVPSAGDAAALTAPQAGDQVTVAAQPVLPPPGNGAAR